MMCDRPAGKAVRSPWTDGAWIMPARDVPPGWVARQRVRPDVTWETFSAPYVGFLQRSDRIGWDIVEARPTPQEDQ